MSADFVRGAAVIVEKLNTKWREELKKKGSTCVREKRAAGIAYGMRRLLSWSELDGMSGTCVLTVCVDVLRGVKGGEGINYGVMDVTGGGI